jgi:hypothetical protein
VGERRGEVYTGFCWRNQRDRDRFQDPGLDGKMIVRCIFRKWYVGYALDRSGSGQGQVAGTCEWGNELSSSIKCGEFLD